MDDKAGSSYHYVLFCVCAPHDALAGLSGEQHPLTEAQNFRNMAPQCLITHYGDPTYWLTQQWTLGPFWIGYGLVQLTVQLVCRPNTLLQAPCSVLTTFA